MKPLVFDGVALHRQCTWATSVDAPPVLSFLQCCYCILHLPQRCLVAKAASLATTTRPEVHADRWSTEVHQFVAKPAHEFHADKGWYDEVVQSSNRQWWTAPGKSSRPQLKEAIQQRQDFYGKNFMEEE